MKIENHCDGVCGDEPYQTHHKCNKSDWKRKYFRERTLVYEMQETNVNSRRNSRPNREHKNRTQNKKHQTLLRQQSGNQHFVDKKHFEHHHADEAQRTDDTEERVARRVHRKKDDEQHSPNDAPFVKAFQQVEVGGGQRRQGSFLHPHDFECKNKTKRDNAKWFLRKIFSASLTTYCLIEKICTFGV